METLNGWKAIAAYLRRDERTAMRWATERSMPVHRMPGPGRGSVYAIAEEIDAWIAADRERAAEADRTVPTIVDPAAPPMVTLASVPWWRRRRVAPALIASGALLAVSGALTLRHGHPGDPAPKAVFADPATKAIFLQAGYDWNLRTPESLARAVQEYGATITRDPRVAPAYVGLANSYLLLREYGSMPDAAAYARAEAAARAAVALSPDCAAAHRALAFIAFWWRQDKTTAHREFDRALAITPDDPLTHHWLANALLANGEIDAALREIGRARDLDPTSTSMLADRGMILYVAGHRAEGLASLRVLAREQPDVVSPHRSLAAIALFEGRRDAFLREALITARLRSDAARLSQLEGWRAAETRPGRIEEAMLRDAKQKRAGWFEIARLAAMAGRPEEAKDALARACNARDPATASAPSDLWLSHSLSPADIAERCGRVLLS